MGKAKSTTSEMRKEEQESKTVHSPWLTYASMLSLLSLCPPFVILLWYTMVHADGSVLQTFNYLKDNGIQGLLLIWPKPTSLIAWKIISVYAAFEAALQLLLPGKTVEGPISPAGNRPVYKANGLQAYAVTLITYVALWWFEIFNPVLVYDHLGEIFSALIFGSLVFCVLLYIKGHVAPSSTDSGSSGNIIIDFYWGMELYPRIGKNFDIKVFTNCRFGMMSWAVLALTYCIKQYETQGRIADSMLVNTTLMLVYVTKFFWWEAGYWNTMDIAHDRAGFYICWGCLVWVPSIYTSPGMYLVNHPVELGTQLALYILVAGILCIYINYDCDRQRQEFRRTNGKCLVWGKAPSKIVASYTTTKGETKTSLLLTSGWWGLSRHFHYLPEILAAFFWTVPALFTHFLPYFYVIFLTILLFDRAKRDDDRCKTKSKMLGITVDGTENTGNCIARRFPTGLSQEFTEIRIGCWGEVVSALEPVVSVSVSSGGSICSYAAAFYLVPHLGLKLMYCIRTEEPHYGSSFLVL
ncbi:OLC1v1015327C1 [Oldenlandia corymbosa var. corymbosa]|uniref:7-dehydrocholesterol reductase n=1 Tax=Oldenlandia corymbosa var. corymbosa TaxID=529605 RepID=A0AAV1E316_OLDCO|nr:OLC1v1015327C1 [Oldenlandia corymbosa var. corymbosa]